MEKSHVLIICRDVNRSSPISGGTMGYPFHRRRKMLNEDNMLDDLGAEPLQDAERHSEPSGLSVRGKRPGF